MYMHNIHCHWVTAHLQTNILYIYKVNNPVGGLERPRRLKEFKVPRFGNNSTGGW